MADWFYSNKYKKPFTKSLTAEEKMLIQMLIVFHPLHLLQNLFISDEMDSYPKYRMKWFDSKILLVKLLLNSSFMKKMTCELKF